MEEKQKANEKYTLDEFAAAIRGSNGIKATIQKRLGCSRNTVDNYLDRYASLRQAYMEEVDRVGDIAESLIINDMVQNRSVETAKWYAMRKLAHRGYGDKQRIDHRITDVSNLTDDELRAIIEDKGGS